MPQHCGSQRFDYSAVAGQQTRRRRQLAEHVDVDFAGASMLVAHPHRADYTAVGGRIRAPRGAS